jgi:hypothetical protein
MNDGRDRFAPLTARERSAHQMKERQKTDDGELVVPVPPATAFAAAHILRRAGRQQRSNSVLT